MKTLYAVPVLLLFLGCATVGTQMEASKLAQIKPGLTTKTEMLRWFGSPTSITVDTTSKVIMNWAYAHAQSYIFSMDVKRQILSVLLNANDVVEKFTPD